MVNVAFNETMSFETQRMCSETSVGRVVHSSEIQVAKATNKQKNGSAEESSVDVCMYTFTDNVENFGSVKPLRR